MRKPPQDAKCIFCGRHTQMTGEHIFSRWTHRYLTPRQPGRDEAWVGTFTSQLGRRSNVVRLPGALRDWMVRTVCGGSHLTCNGGWMKAIDDKAQPIITKLILGKHFRISPQDQQIIATWATLKTIVAQYDDAFLVRTHHTQRKRLMKKGLPPEDKLGVWIGHYERDEWAPEWTSRPSLILTEERRSKRSTQEATYFNSNSISQIIGKLYIHVISAPMSFIIHKWKFSLPDSGAFFRIWPPGDYSIVWPGKVLTDRDADYVSNAFAAFAVSVARRRATSA